jgi:type I restriction enzyme S subunit
MLLLPGDIYVSLKDVTQSADLLGSVARVPHNILKGRVTQDTVKLIFKDEKYSKTFIYWVLRTPQYRDYCRAHATGTTNLGLPREDFLAFPIPEATDFRMGLVELLEALDDKIELNRQTNETLEALARALFKDWFVDFGPTRTKAEGGAPYLAPELWALFPDALDDEDKPVGWRSARLEEAVEFNPREKLKKEAEAPYLDMASLPTVGSLPDAPKTRSFTSGTRFRNGDTLLARITPCLENGKTAHIQCLDEGEIGWGSTEFIVLRSKPPIPKGWTYLLARDSAFRDFAVQSMTGTSGRQRARTEALAEYPVVIPDDPVWLAFSDLLDPIFEKVEAGGEESRTLVQTRDLLLPKLMSGEIRLRDAEREVEAVL